MDEYLNYWGTGTGCRTLEATGNGFGGGGGHGCGIFNLKPLNLNENIRKSNNG
jgi:hypothetical protein